MNQHRLLQPSAAFYSLLQQPDNDEEEDLSVWVVEFDSTIKYDWDYGLQSALSLKTKSFSPIAAECVSEDNTFKSSGLQNNIYTNGLQITH
jgi:hypothetical protein